MAGPVRLEAGIERLADAAVADPDRPVFCSNLRALGPMVFALTHTAAKYATVSAHLYPLHLIRVIGQDVDS